MTVIDRLRAALPSAEEPAHTSPWGPGWRRAALIGALTALVSAALVVVPVVLAWDAAPLDGTERADAVRLGAALWLLLGGAHVSAGPATITLTPLLGTAVLVVLARYGAREAMVRVRTDGGYWAGTLPRDLAGAVGAWWAGYALGTGAVWAVAHSGALVPRPWTVLVPAFLVPVAGLWLALAPVARDDPDVLGPRLVPVLPDVVRRGLGPGLAGVALLVVLGTLVIGVAVLLAWPQVAAVQDGLTADRTDVLVLALAQVAALPNLALWVVSLMGGPGFTVVGGAVVSWDGVESGLLPLVPVLGALPQPGPYPVPAALGGLAVLVGAGVWVGRRAVATVARLSRLRTKLAVATCACATTSLAVGALDLLGGGSAGQFRLAAVGAPAGRLALSVFLALLVGAVGYVLRDAWRLRR
ncbi:DUF6350 family protein [Phycicoccus sp. CSK15P-2]|uniref:cell division protein PerM n=1 Tax=Phycicoccus sp. CSK15P-2 TaxID=2807627 RepID=UPI001EF17CA8|nr:DUF6350 family protein [Phycicoccus sp. CSK15P-2]